MIDFNRIRPSDLWYLIGYIASDGYLSKDRRHIDITSKDETHLYSIKNAIYLRNRIRKKYRSIYDRKPYFRLQFGDVNFYKYLLGIGFTQKKSLHLEKIDVPNDFLIDFLRGVIDGDGNISTWVHKVNKNHQWCLRIYSASYIFITWINDKIREHFNIKGRLYSTKPIYKNNCVYRLKFGKKAAGAILKQLYYPRCLCLERKALQAKLCLQSCRKVVN